MQIEATETFEKNYEALFNGDQRFIINQGGSRSGKTWGLCQLMIIYAITKPNTEIAIVRKAMATTRTTVMKDFFKVMKDLNLYNSKQHNKTESIYRFQNGSSIIFMGADDEQKLRGLSSQIVWANEANELWYDDFFQLNLRCTDKFIVDFNPSDADNWIYNLPTDDSVLIKSTYKDNPFLGDIQIKEIERLIETDEALYTIYALGERAATRQNIFQQWNWVEAMPPQFNEDDYIYAVDFGYVHPMAVVKIFYNDESEIFIQPILYESGLTGLKAAERLRELGLNEYKDMVCDFARPEIMEELRNFDFNVMNADKAVDAGIDCVRRFKIYAMENEDLKKEYQNYMYRKIRGKLTSEPLKQFDDYMDAVRYGCMHVKKYYINVQSMESR